ncbi:unnamed protein product [Rotaria sp. Silwood2]|nr:unnamed protein product [Rotaria sp. Silwood2]CAF4019661.1 unnamed protein product [Rotaria sp. Silwood2]
MSKYYVEVMSSSLETVLIYSISLQLFEDAVLVEDGYTYERTAITEWIHLNKASPLTRQPFHIEALRPKFNTKKVIKNFENSIQSKNHKFKLVIDIRRDKRALFQTFGKRIYRAEWITQQQQLSVIILQIDEARAQKEALFYVKHSRYSYMVLTYGLVEDVIQNTTSIMLLQEYTPEESLFEVLSDQQELPHDKTLQKIFIQISDTMIFLVYNQIVHGDVACRNVLMFQFVPNETKQTSTVSTNPMSSAADGRLSEVLHVSSFRVIETSITLGILCIQLPANSSSSSSTRHQHISTSTYTRSTSNHRSNGKTHVNRNANCLHSRKTRSMKSVEISGTGINADIFVVECSGFN